MVTNAPLGYDGPYIALARDWFYGELGTPQEYVRNMLTQDDKIILRTLKNFRHQTVYLGETLWARNWWVNRKLVPRVLSGDIRTLKQMVLLVKSWSQANMMCLMDKIVKDTGKDPRVVAGDILMSWQEQKPLKEVLDDE